MRFSVMTPVVLLCGSVATSAIARIATTQPASSRNPRVIYVVSEDQTFRQSSPYLPPPPRVIAPDSIAQQYSVVIRLDSAADTTPTPANTPISNHDAQMAASLLTSTAIIDPAASRALGLSPQQRRDAVVVNMYLTGLRIARVEVTLLKGHGDYAPDAARKLTSALLESLKKAFEQSAQAARKAAIARRGSVEKELKDTKDQADALHAKIRELRNVNPNTMRGMDAQSALDTFKNQKRNNESEITRLKERLASIEPASAPLAKELAEVVKLREQQLEVVKKSQQAGTATPADVADAQAKLIESRAALAQATQSSSPSRFDRGGEIPSLRSSIADAEERLKQTNEQMARLEDPKLAAAFDQLPQMQSEEQRVRGRLFELNTRLEQISRASDVDAGVVITLLDGSQGNGED